MQDYFLNLSLTEAKQVYKDLYKANFMNSEFIADLNAQLSICATLAAIPAPTLAANEDNGQLQDKAKFAANLEGCKVEISGTWIWVSGNTKEHKDTLSANGFRFSGSKKQWYWTAKKFNNWKGSKTKRQIRMKYGSEPVQAEAAF